MAVMSGLGAAREIRKFEEAHSIRPAVIIGLRMRWTHDALPDCLEAGFDAITIEPLSTDFFREFLCGPPETNLFVQYGCLSQEEQRWHAQRYRRALASPEAYLYAPAPPVRYPVTEDTDENTDETWESHF
ncbi:hypothetical protein E8E14_000551 [Neopestalotiopsis sp. 37M]|nr:hypothetical protein E8E14_000551 [Neopestalotiopsis sp. 37M]